MKKMTGLLALLLALGAAVPPAAAQGQSLARVTFPDEDPAALGALKDWLDARGIECSLQPNGVALRRGGVLMAVTPLVLEGDLDRLRVTASFAAKREHKGSKALAELASRLNASQNFVQVWVDPDGDLGTGGNITFYDELAAREFDAFTDLFVQTVKRYVLTDEALAFLN